MPSAGKNQLGGPSLRPPLPLPPPFSTFSSSKKSMGMKQSQRNLVTEVGTAMENVGHGAIRMTALS